MKTVCSLLGLIIIAGCTTAQKPTTGLMSPTKFESLVRSKGEQEAVRVLTKGPQELEELGKKISVGDKRWIKHFPLLRRNSDAYFTTTLDGALGVLFEIDAKAAIETLKKSNYERSDVQRVCATTVQDFQNLELENKTEIRAQAIARLIKRFKNLYSVKETPTDSTTHLCLHGIGQRVDRWKFIDTILELDRTKAPLFSEMRNSMEVIPPLHGSYENGRKAFLNGKPEIEAEEVYRVFGKRLIEACDIDCMTPGVPSWPHPAFKNQRFENVVIPASEVGAPPETNEYFAAGIKFAEKFNLKMLEFASKESTELEFETLDGDQARKILNPCSRSGPERVTGFWKVPEDQALMVERSFEYCLSHPELLPLSKYKRQYAGFIRDDRLFIYLSAVRSAAGNTKASKEAEILCDGGTLAFGAEFDIDTYSLHNFRFNSGVGSGQNTAVIDTCAEMMGRDGK